MSIDASPSETISRGGVPTPKIARIREKTARMFWDIPAPWPVWQSGAFSQRKITADSTYWEAKRWLDGLEQAENGNTRSLREKW